MQQRAFVAYAHENILKSLYSNKTKNKPLETLASKRYAGQSEPGRQVPITTRTCRASVGEPQVVISNSVTDNSVKDCEETCRQVVYRSALLRRFMEPDFLLRHFGSIKVQTDASRYCALLVACSRRLLRRWKEGRTDHIFSTRRSNRWVR